MVFINDEMKRFSKCLDKSMIYRKIEREKKLEKLKKQKAKDAG